jgi:hypothetical protein
MYTLFTFIHARRHIPLIFTFPPLRLYTYMYAYMYFVHIYVFYCVHVHICLFCFT